MKDAKFRIRRRMAKTAFATIILSVFLLITAGFLGGENVASNFKEMSGVLIALFGCLTTLVLGYQGAVSVDDYQTKKQLETNEQLKTHR